MANSSINLTTLDFNTLKSNFQNYLTSQSVFKDYNFNSSSMSVLLDIFAYNSYLNSFYLNMVASEMFMDSAQKLNSVVSHAKELNYTPLSAASSYSNISFTATTVGITNPFVIPAGTQFHGQNSNGSFTFVTDQTESYVSANNVYNITNLQVFEGINTTDSFVVNYSTEQQIFVLSNQSVDISSLVVTVYENNGQNVTTFTPVTTLFGLNGESNVYFIQGSSDAQYEILFGDGLFGRVPLNGSIVKVNYRVCAGTSADGVNTFNCTQDLGAMNGGIATLSTIVATSSTGSSNAEGIESIRFNAPRFYATQNRAVASDDFQSLVIAQFGSQISAVNVYGGELLTPKQYGCVALCLKPTTSTVAPDYIKNQIINYLITKNTIPTRIVITDPDYFYCAIQSVITYNSVQSQHTVSELTTLINNTLYNFTTLNLNAFNSNLRFSKLVAAIDNTDVSVLSNDTQIQMIKRITPAYNIPTSYIINFNNPLSVEMPLDAIYQLSPLSDEPIIYSSTFTYVDASGNQYQNAVIRDDNYGTLIVFNIVNKVINIINNNIGTVNYTTGVVNINNLITNNYTKYISIYAILENTDILVSKNQIITIDLNDVSLTITSG